MPNIKPIETYYNGYRFRSRLEARWAVFFDALGVKYEYEPEGFDLGDGLYYLPDFRVECWGCRGGIGEEPFDLWIEVKGKMTPEDAEKIRRFANFNEDGDDYGPEHPILIVGNIPAHGDSSDSSALGVYDGNGPYPFNYELIDGDYFGAYPAAAGGKFFLWGDDSNYIWNESEVEAAYDKARQARFEHGETPNI